MDVAYFISGEALRDWLAGHGAGAGELWVGFRRVGSGQASITYPEALDEALCAGWIDGVRRAVDESSYAVRFSPRRPGSTWSEVNVRRARQLIEAGRMLPTGLAAFEAVDPARTARSSHEVRARPLDLAYEAVLAADPAARAFWEAQPPSYRRAASWYVMSAVKEETRQRRLATLVAESAGGRRIAAVTLEPKPR